jgi:hypothetical protein
MAAPEIARFFDALELRHGDDRGQYRLELSLIDKRGRRCRIGTFHEAFEAFRVAPVSSRLWRPLRRSLFVAGEAATMLSRHDRWRRVEGLARWPLARAAGLPRLLQRQRAPFEIARTLNEGIAILDHRGSCNTTKRGRRTMSRKAVISKALSNPDAEATARALAASTADLEGDKEIVSFLAARPFTRCTRGVKAMILDRAKTLRGELLVERRRAGLLGTGSEVPAEPSAIPPAPDLVSLMDAL